MPTQFLREIVKGVDAGEHDDGSAALRVDHDGRLPCAVRAVAELRDLVARGRHTAAVGIGFRQIDVILAHRRHQTPVVLLLRRAASRRSAGTAPGRLQPDR